MSTPRTEPSSEPTARRRRARLHLGAPLLAPLLLTPLLADVAAEAQQGTGALSGTVRTADGTAVSGAQIVVPGLTTGVVSAADGRYLLAGVQPGSRVVEVHHIGYRTAAATVTFEAGLPREWNVTLELEPVPIDALEVTSLRGRTPALEGFFLRRERGLGHFFTRSDIEEMNAREITDILRRVPGARIVPIPGPFGTSNVLQLSRSLGASNGRTCPILYYMNGVPFPVRADIGIDAYVRAQDVEAVEVYSGTSRIPPEFTSTGQTSRCGVVGLWTRIGNGKGGASPKDA